MSSSSMRTVPEVAGMNPVMTRMVRGFAGAVGAEEAENRALVGIEGNVADRDEVAVNLGQMPYFNHSVIDLHPTIAVGD